jgi:hypothetical protein
VTTASGAEIRHPPASEVLRGRWMTRKISVAPFGRGWWSFNPCVHRDPEADAWRCVLRIANYSLPRGVPQLSPDARRGRAVTRNVIGTLNPETLEVSDLREVMELDRRTRAPTCVSLGYEDVRLFRASGRLRAVATALQLNLEYPSRPEIVLLDLSEDGDVADARPLRGPWSDRPQKNWAPFDGADDVRLLSSIERGVVMSDCGIVSSRPAPSPDAAPDPPAIRSPSKSGAEVRMMGSARLGRPPRPPAPAAPSRPAPGSTELRGGSQLVEIERGRWLGVAHETRLTHSEHRKLYWHTLYTVDSSGILLQRSAPFKLSTCGIEFAAGLAVDDRGGVAISYGTDDHDAWIGVTTLGAIEAALDQPGAGRSRRTADDV